MIDVLLATYNGEAYLPDLLESLEQQAYADWQLIVRDDGSTDGTLSIIEEWAKEHPGKVRVLRDGRSRLGPSASFGALMEASEAPYFMFCDQDDVWLPEKMTVLLNAVCDAEKRRGTHAPVLAHSDLILVDENRRPLGASFWRQQGTLPSSRHSHRGLILQNWVTGCALMGNGALRRHAFPIPQEAVMHDWWVAMVAAFAGELVELSTPTVLYRQHGGNSIGAKGWGVLDLLGRFFSEPFAAIERTRSVIRKTQAQAAVFANRFAAMVDAKTIDLCREYAALGKKGFWERKAFFVRRRLWPTNRYRAGIFWFFV